MFNSLFRNLLSRSVRKAALRNVKRKSTCRLTVERLEDRTVPSGLADTAWPMFGMNAQHTGDSPYVGPQTAAVAFQVQTPSIIGPSGLISHRELMGFDGSLQSDYPSARQYLPAVAADGTIYTASESGTLFAANPNLPGAYVNDNAQLVGGTKWTIMLGQSQYAPTIGPDGTVYVSALDSYLYAVNPEGTLKWKFKAHQEFESAPALSADGLVVYAGSDDNSLYAVHTATGTLKWKFKATDDVNAAPAVDAAGNIYITTSNWYGWSINKNGKLNWKVPLREGRGSTLAFCNSDPGIDQASQTVYFGGFDGMYAYSFAGALKWKYTTGSQVNAHPAIGADGLVYFGAFNETLYAVRPDGDLQWLSPNTGGTNGRAILASDGTLYCGFKAFKDGGVWRPTVRWLQDTPDPVAPGGDLLLRASQGQDNGFIVGVNYYRDANGNNQLDVGVDDLVGTDTDGSNGWAIVVAAPGTPGTYTYFAQAIDNDGYLSNVVSKTNTVSSTAPQIGSFTASTADDSVTLTAADVVSLNPGGVVVQVAFYVDFNNDGNLTLLGYGTQTSSGVWTLTFSTTGWASGTYSLSAQALDNFGAFSDPFALMLEV